MYKSCYMIRKHLSYCFISFIMFFGISTNANVNTDKSRLEGLWTVKNHAGITRLAEQDYGVRVTIPPLQFYSLAVVFEFYHLDKPNNILVRTHMTDFGGDILSIIQPYNCSDVMYTQPYCYDAPNLFFMDPQMAAFTFILKINIQDSNHILLQDYTSSRTIMELERV